MERLLPLSHLTPGSCAMIQKLTAKGEIRRRLMDLGFIPGAAVQCVRRSALGDPSAYRICGAIVALRKTDADTIWIIQQKRRNGSGKPDSG